MTTASDIVSRAYREANFTAVGDASPSANELAEGLTLLQSISDSLFPLVVGTKLTSWFVPRPQANSAKYANYPASPGDAGIVAPNDVKHPPSNVRIVAKNTAAETVYFQYQPQDGAIMEYVDAGHTADLTLNANGSLFGLTGTDDSITITSDFANGVRNTRRRWIYRADAAAWVEVSDLVLTEEMPYPAWFDDYFVTALAMRLSPSFGSDPRNVTLMRHREMVVFIRQQYEQMGIAIIGTPTGRNSEQSFEPYEHNDYSSGLV